MEKLTELTEILPRTPEAVLAGIMRRFGTTPAPTSTALLDAPPAYSSGSTRAGEPDALPAGPFPAVVAWLRALDAPRPEVPPYVLRLVALLDRIGDGTADDSDRVRLRSWLPNGIFNARLVHRRDLAAGAALLAELGATP